MTIVSALALVVNVAALAYIIYQSGKRHINPYKQDVFVEQKYYKEAAARNPSADNNLPARLSYGAQFFCSFAARVKLCRADPFFLISMTLTSLIIFKFA